MKLHYVPGVLSALQRCLLETPNSVYDTLDYSLTIEVLVLLENLSLLLLGVLYGDQDACATDEGNGAICGMKSRFGHKVYTPFQICRTVNRSVLS